MLKIDLYRSLKMAATGAPKEDHNQLYRHRKEDKVGEDSMHFNLFLNNSAISSNIRTHSQRNQPNDTLGYRVYHVNHSRNCISSSLHVRSNFILE